MSAVDSKAVFAARVKFLGLGEFLDRFVELHWSTHAELAFVSGARPGHDDNKFVEDILIPGLGSDEHPKKHLLRRLYFESFAMASGEIRRLQEPNAPDVPRVVPQPEMEARRAALAQRLPGLAVDGMFVGEQDVSDRLLQRCIHLFDTNALAYVSLDLCTKRDFEVLGHRRDPYLAPVQDVNGYLRMQSQQPETYCSVATQTLFENAFVRRNLAMDMGDVMSFDLGEKLRRTLVAALTEEVPPGHVPVSLNQLVAADKKFWVKLASATRGGVRRSDDVDRPCDKHGEKILEGVPFNLMLAPRAVMAAPAQTPSQGSGHREELSKREKEVIKKQTKVEQAKTARARIDQTRQPAQADENPTKDRRGRKGKGAGKNQVRMPVGLEGMATKTSAATGMRRLCFGYNLGTCTAATPGEACPKGLHGCMKPAGPNGDACADRHPASACTK